MKERNSLEKTTVESTAAPNNQIKPKIPNPCRQLSCRFCLTEFFYLRNIAQLS